MRLTQRRAARLARLNRTSIIHEQVRDMTHQSFRGTILAAALASVMTAVFSGPAFSQEFDGSKARVNLANKLRTLTQQVGSASCRIDAGIGVEMAQAELYKAKSEFNTILSGLENGSMALGIPSPERYGVVMQSLAAVKETWAPMDQAAADLLESRGNPRDAAELIAANNLPLLEATKILASDVWGKYSNPNELTQADAMAMNIAGRQLMLSQRITKEVCGIASSSAELGTTEALGATLDMYSVSLKALREGMVDAGVNPPPTEAVSRELDSINGAWQETLPTLAAIRGGLVPSSENVATLASMSDRLTRDMGNVVTLYMLATPGQEDVYRVPLRAYAEEQLSKWLENPELIDAVRTQNVAHANLSQAQIDQLDLDWRAQRKSEDKPLIDRLLSHSSSAWLRERQAETASFVTEVFAMDNRGLNVAQSVETSDYWQGDEDKWQLTYGNGSGDIHISEVEFDESTGTYQSQVSMPIRDPNSGDLIGAITFGINVQSLL
jgi:hypothetical protein